MTFRSGKAIKPIYEYTVLAFVREDALPKADGPFCPKSLCVACLEKRLGRRLKPRL